MKSPKLTLGMSLESVSLGCEDYNLWVWSHFFCLSWLQQCFMSVMLCLKMSLCRKNPGMLLNE